jgi:hypothetical protein
MRFRSVSTGCAAAVLALLMAAPAFAGNKFSGSTTLGDVQPAGTKDKGQKHQVFDLSFDGSGNRYTCRTDSDKSMNATDFVVGGPIRYEVDGQKGKIRTPQGKKVECTIVRVEALTGPRAVTPYTSQQY